MPAELEQEVTVGGTPGGAGVPPTSGTTSRVRSNPMRQYIAGSAYQFYVDMPRALPWAFTDVQVDFGDDIFERMMLDPQVISTINTLKAATIDRGLALLPAIQDKDDPQYDAAVAMLEAVERMFANLQQSPDTVLWNMLDSFALGSKVGEQIYDLETAPSGKRQYTLTQVAVRPRKAVAFVVDVYNNLLGILGRVPGTTMSTQAGTLLTDLEHTPNLLPRAKFAIHTFRPIDGDPRGTSLLRPAFAPWQAKVEMQREFIKYLAQFAVPSMIGHTAAGAQPSQALNEDGTLQFNDGENPVMITPEEALFYAMTGLQNGSVIVLPAGADAEPMEVRGDGSAFLNAFAMYDREIAKAILNQTLATEQAEHQARAASATHKDVLDTTTRQLKPAAERIFGYDVLRTWALLNGHDVALLPKCSLAAAESEDRTGLMDGYSKLAKAGLVDESQKPGIDEQLGMPKRAIEQEELIPVNETVQVKEDGGTVTPPGGEATAPAPNGTQGTEQEGAA